MTGGDLTHVRSHRDKGMGLQVGCIALRTLFKLVRAERLASLVRALKWIQVRVG